jgi:hypothetical protein
MWLTRHDVQSGVRRYAVSISHPSAVPVIGLSLLYAVLLDRFKRLVGALLKRVKLLFDRT